MNNKYGITIPYINFRGNFKSRRIEPLSIEYGYTEWHGEAYTLIAYDYGKSAKRSFCLQDIIRGAIVHTLESVGEVASESKVSGIMNKLNEEA